MKIIYCKGWSRRRKFANQTMSKESAMELHNAKKPYGVTVLEGEDVPYCFINFNNKFVYVGFLDDLKREYLKYSFWETEKDKIFLKEVQFWEYKDDTYEKLSSTRYRFTPEGEFGKEIKNYVTKETDRLIAKNKIEVSPLYEDYPEFGNYEKIVKIEREIPDTMELT